MIGWNEEIKKELGACGQNVFIGHNVIFTQPKNVFLGDNVRIDPFTLITSKLKTGNYVQITAYAMLGGKDNFVILDDWTFIGYGSKLFTGSEDYSGEEGPVNEFWGSNKTYKGDIHFKKFSGVASDVIVFPGVTLPEGCCIGAQSLVPRNPRFGFHTKMVGHDDQGNVLLESIANGLEEYTVYCGNPLKKLKNRNKENINKLYNDPLWLKKH